MRRGKKRQWRLAVRSAVLGGLLALSLSGSVCALGLNDSIAGYRAGQNQTEETLTPYPFSLRIRFDESSEDLTEGDTQGWCTQREDGTLVWNEHMLTAYFEILKEKYDTKPGEVAFTTHDGVKKIFKSDNCGWHMNVDFSVQNLKAAVQNGQEEMDPAWNSGLIYSSQNGVGSSYVEVNLEKQKVYLYKEGREIFETDCVSGTYGLTETRKGVFQISSKASPATLRDVDLNGDKYEQPVEYWIAFNGSQGLHDALWRGSFGGDIYKTWGSHGCVNLALEAAKRIYEEVYLYYPVIVY